MIARVVGQRIRATKTKQQERIQWEEATNTKPGRRIQNDVANQWEVGRHVVVIMIM
jgi:hypothetical protein